VIHKPVGFGLPRRIHQPVAGWKPSGEPPAPPSTACASARAYHDSDISISNATGTPITTLNSEIWDNDDIHSLVSDTGRLTCQSAGTYAITGGVHWTNSGAVYTYHLGIILNGTTLITADSNYRSSYGGDGSNTVGTIYQLEVGDYVELWVWQNSGGALNVEADVQYSPELSMVKIT
jgi:hypothetical protein